MPFAVEKDEENDEADGNHIFCIPEGNNFRQAHHDGNHGHGIEKTARHVQTTVRINNPFFLGHGYGCDDPGRYTDGGDEVENRFPAQIIGKEAAQSRSHRKAAVDRRNGEAHGPATPFRLRNQRDDSHTRRKNTGTADALQEAQYIETFQGRDEIYGQGRNTENRNPEKEDMPLANAVGNLADGHDRHRRRNQEQFDDPAQLSVRSTIIRADTRQGRRQGAARKRVDKRHHHDHGQNGILIRKKTLHGEKNPPKMIIGIPNYNAGPQKRPSDLFLTIKLT